MLFLGLFLYSFHVTEDAVITSALKSAQKQPNLTAYGVGQSLYSAVCDPDDSSERCEVQIFDEKQGPLFFMPAFKNSEFRLITFTKRFPIRLFDKPTFVKFTISPSSSLIYRTAVSSMAISLLPAMLFVLIVFMINRRKLEADLQSANLKMALAASKAELNEIAAQVAHDIRSPLSALNLVVGSLDTVPEDRRELIRHASVRINEIANNLLLRSRGTQKESVTVNPNSEEQLVYVPELLELLVAEKLNSFIQDPEVDFQMEFSGKELGFALLNVRDFSRSVSNLLNNSIEAIQHSNGLVKIIFSADARSKIIEVKILDNGIGIPKEIVESVGAPGFSFGKKLESGSGSGRGFSFARNFFRTCGGDLRVESSTPSGTNVVATLPLMSMPAWLLTELNLKGVRTFVSVDDDFSIHQVWSTKLQEYRFSGDHVKLNSGYALSRYLEDPATDRKYCFFAVDCDFRDANQNGLQLIRKLSLMQTSVLVTGRWNEEGVCAEASRLSVGIIPKSFVGLIRINA
jgi:signal transduction histidine kinase